MDLVKNINVKMSMVIIIAFVSINTVEPTCLASAGGSACCAGYMRNKTTGECEKCPLGYYGLNCVKKCPSPSYGEDCQSICSCEALRQRCDFAFGCVLADDFHYTSHVMANSTTIETSTYPPSTGAAFVRKTSLSDVSTFQKDTLTSDTLTRDTLTRDSERTLFENSYIIYIIISLVGLFVFFFGIFVITYSYQKCFRRRSTANLQDIDIMNQTVQYKALHFGAEEQRLEIHSDQLRRLNSDPTYLSPVYDRQQGVESQMVPGNIAVSENVQDLQLLQDNSLFQENEGEKISMVQDSNQNNHVYVEIIDENGDSDGNGERCSPEGRDSYCYVNTET